MPKNEPFPALDASIEDLAGNTRMFTWNAQGEVWAILSNEGFMPGRLEIVCTCRDWPEAYVLSELLNKLRRFRDKIELDEIRGFTAEFDKRRGL
jgi:hypothetical protein